MKTENELLATAKATIEKYYLIVDIKKTGGFTNSLLANGHTRHADTTYIYPGEAGNIQLEIIKNNNKLILQKKLNGVFKIWLMNYENKLIRK